MPQNVFETLNKINVNEHTEDKNGLAYLSWAWAWQEVKGKFPEATYTVYKNERGLPYVYDENTGYMVYTTVTIDGVTHEMWLPVMDSANHAMKSEPYTIKTRYKDVTVAPATMFDVNKTIMRCLVKNLAMFGCGLYIYAGEDLPDNYVDYRQLFLDTCKNMGYDPANIGSAMGLNKQSTDEDFEVAYRKLCNGEEPVEFKPTSKIELGGTDD